MFTLRSKINYVRTRIWLRWFMLKNRNARISGDLVLHGIPIFSFAPSSHVEIGRGVTFTSDPRVNMVGLSKRCSVYVGEGAELVISDHSGFSGISIYCVTRIQIGKHLTCGGNVSIWDTDFHPLDSVARRNHKTSEIKQGAVTIGDDVFIGAGSVIMKGVTIGNKAVIGAGSVVTKSIPGDEVWAGNPARQIPHKRA